MLLTLRDALIQIDLSVPEVAARIGCHPNTLYAATAGRRLSRRTAYKLGQLFARSGLTVDLAIRERQTHGGK